MTAAVSKGPPQKVSKGGVKNFVKASVVASSSDDDSQ